MKKSKFNALQDYPAHIERGNNLGDDVLIHYGLEPAGQNPAPAANAKHH
jgi:hypothetical protein